MTCRCSVPGCDEFFTDRIARRDAARFRRRGLDGPARDIVEAVLRRGAHGRTVLEVGGGVGTIPIALLREGASSAEVAELSPVYDGPAERLLAEAGLTGRVRRTHLDFAARAAEVAPADIVIMNRVICCYPDHRALAGAAAGHAGAMLVVTYPRDAWWTRLGIGVINAFQRLRRRRFRVHLHPPAGIADTVRSHGLETTELRCGAVWELHAFERRPPRA